ncbi:unnamed protein product [Medioppia subpectinata]|uniref:Uncharacterized protein n=1 Tax=Medioppia subpectinata TaxID=1979941 RepID=A0A7R9KM33_9ACAR|nr:unnamed protein product [Medioppia subpectinata]CAG2104886.1 unnamed protein product [Medioppia subpectinata]
MILLMKNLFILRDSNRVIACNDVIVLVSSITQTPSFPALTNFGQCRGGPQNRFRRTFGRHSKKVANGQITNSPVANLYHAYQIVKANTIPDENIIIMHYDDIANNRQNKYPGKVYNGATGHNGTDVYHGVHKHYTGKEVTPENFLKKLSRDKGLKKAGMRVLKSGPNDHVFIFYDDHGGPDFVAFFDKYLYNEPLMKTLNQMHQDKKYAKLVYVNSNKPIQYNTKSYSCYNPMILYNGWDVVDRPLTDYLNQMTEMEGSKMTELFAALNVFGEVILSATRRIMNRFSKDVSAIDEVLPNVLYKMNLYLFNLRIKGRMQFCNMVSIN